MNEFFTLITYPEVFAEVNDDYANPVCIALGGLFVVGLAVWIVVRNVNSHAEAVCQDNLRKIIEIRELERKLEDQEFKIDELTQELEAATSTIMPINTSTELSKPPKTPVVLDPAPSEFPTTSADTAFLPQRMEFQIGGFCGTSHNIIYVGDGRLEYRFAFINYKWGKSVFLKPDRSNWETFWRDMDSIGVWQWKQTYRKHVIDGTQWTLDLNSQQNAIHSKGDNDFPGDDGGDWSRLTPAATILKTW